MSARDATPAVRAPTFDASACAAALDAAMARALPDPTPEAAARGALEALIGATRSTRGSILRLDPATACLTLIAGTGIPDHLLGQLLRPRPRSIAYWVYRNREGLLLQGRVNDARFEASAGAENIESSLCLSILGEAGPVGVLNLARSSDRGAFTEEDLHALSGLVDHLGKALETLFSAEFGRQCLRQIADLEGPRSLSRLAHGVTETRAFEFALAKRPGLRLAADRCERVALDGGLHALMMADAPGTATGAAALSGFLHGLFSGFSVTERSARGMAARLDAEVRVRSGIPASGSMWIAFLSPRGEVRSCAAGAPRPLWVPADGSPIQSLEAGGPPLGAGSDEAYEEESFRMLPGDLLVAVSDGVLDARDPTDSPFGRAALEERVARQHRDSLERLVAGILEAAADHGRHTRPADDQVVLAVRYTAGR